MTPIITVAVVSAQKRNVQALHALISAIGVHDPKAVQIVPIVVFMAFTVEAYVNDLGFRHITDWKKKERRPWKEKIEILHKEKTRPVDWNFEHLAFIKELFSIRDRLAHGKPERVYGPQFDSKQEANEHVISSEFDPDWFLELPVWYHSSRDKFFQALEYLAILHALSPTDYLGSSVNMAVE
jgi:hypothetical protein